MPISSTALPNKNLIQTASAVPDLSLNYYFENYLRLLKIDQTQENDCNV
jgi:hypothetical protein